MSSRDLNEISVVSPSSARRLLRSHECRHSAGAHECVISLYLCASRANLWRLCEYQNVFVHVLEQEIWWVGIATENRALTVCRAPTTTSPVLRPNDLVDHNKSQRTQRHREISTQGKCKEPMICMLINVR